MDEKNENQFQGELFDDFADSRKAHLTRRKGSFLGSALEGYQRQMTSKWGRPLINLSFEGLILLGIGLIIASVVSFSLGIEKGKSLRPSELTVELASAPEESKTEEITTLQLEEPSLDVAQVSSVSTSSDTKRYTIQVVTYRKGKFVQRELERLKGSGYEAFVIERGGFSQICAGRYSDKQEALAALGKLKKIYKDCYIRNYK